MAVLYPGALPTLLTRFGINPLDFTAWTDLLKELDALFVAAGTNPMGSGGTMDGRFTSIETELASPALVVNTADSAAITNTTTETAFSNGKYTVPADSATIGRTFRITAGGKFSTMAGSPGSLTFNVRWGSANTDPLLVNLPMVPANLTASLANAGWFLIVIVTVRTLGASGSANGTGTASLYNTTPLNNDLQPSTTTINTTAAKDLTLFAKWSVANASNTITLENFIVEQVN